MNTSILFLASLCLVAFAVAQDCSCNNTLQVATFNTLQIPITTARQERLDAQINYFKGRVADIDILCLQELWVPSDRNAYIDSLAGAYPYNAQAGPVASTCSAPCSASDVEAILTCANSASCLGTTTGLEFFDCLDDQCNLDDGAVSDSCEDCLENPFESGLSVRAKFRNCAGLRNVYDDVDTSCQYVFGNQTDNLILSKYPIISNDTLYYTISPFSVWSVTHAAIAVPDFGTVHAFCTHLVASQPFFDLSQESLNQTNQLVAFIQSKTNASDIVFVMGDFNAGPEGENINAAFPDTYWYIRNSEFSDSQWLYGNITGTPLQCTYCDENGLTSIGTKDEILDHIFISNSSSICVQNVEIFGKEKLATSSDGTEIELSDHYGVRGTYCLASRTVDSIPPPPTAVSSSSGSSGDDGSTASSTEIKFLFIIFSVIGALLAL